MVAAGLWREGQALRVHLGCGSLRLPGFVNIDSPPPPGGEASESVDVYVNPFAIDFPDELVDEVRFSFGNRALTRAQAIHLVARAHVWLRRGASLRFRESSFASLADTPERLEYAVAALGFADVRLLRDPPPGDGGQGEATVEATKRQAMSRADLMARARTLHRKPLRITYLITSILAVTGGNMTLLDQVEELRRRGHAVTIVTHTQRPAWTTVHAEVVQVPPGEPMATRVPPSDVVVSTYCANTHELLSVQAPVKVYYAQGDQFVFGDDTPAADPAVEQHRQALKEMSRRSYGYPGVHFVANSNNLLQAVVRSHGIRAEAVLPVCTDQTIFRPLQRALSGSRMRILVVGPDVKGTGAESLAFKGIADVRHALELVSERFKNFTAVRIANTQPEIFRDFPCEYHVIPSDEMKTFLFGTADILVYASHYDSCPRPPQEGMASGCAVVCTDTSGAREYCVHEENCLLVPIENPRAMADAILRLVADRGLREKVAAGGKKTAGQYPREREWDELEALLYGYVEGAGRG